MVDVVKMYTEVAESLAKDLTEGAYDAIEPHYSGEIINANTNRAQLKLDFLKYLTENWTIS